MNKKKKKFRQHRRPFCPIDVLVVGSTPFVFDERHAIRVLQVQDSGIKKKRKKEKNEKKSIKKSQYATFDRKNKRIL